MLRRAPAARRGHGRHRPADRHACGDGPAGRDGHERIAFVAGPRRDYDADLRLEAWQEALVERDLPAPPVYLGSWEAEDGYRAGCALAESILAAPQQAPTAVFVANDHMAIGLLRACTEAGVRIPQDLSVVGFDDIPGAAHLLPPLTTVHQPFDQLGRAAVEALIAAIEGSDGGSVRLLPPRLVERASHGPARTHR
ncbi:substrate-binding domain-containing protein [Arsenicicoccus bolidensis]|uniref:substrate-binding domain-containing protein n=1 Tax=Arsenicicoccus bolidensis TaxID=229480 RepID=UPI0027DF6C3B|nr:substrate-binding domain-containing protein [Arsenicicoccus bolidensis]